MKTIFIFLPFILSCTISFCQSDNIATTDKNRAIYVELYGNSGHTISLNYEKFFNSNNNFGYRVGCGFLPMGRGYFTIPIEFIYTYGEKVNFLDFSLGSTYAFEFVRGREFGSTFIFFGRIGSRHKIKNLLIRIGFTPAIDPMRAYFTSRVPINSFVGFSIGYSF